MSGEIAVIGDGAMGTVCAIMLAENGFSVRLWSAFPEAAERLARERENTRFLPGPRLDDGVRVTGDDTEALAATDSVVEGVATTAGVVELAARHGVEMPITHAIHDILTGRRSGAEAIDELMTRPLKAEC